MPMAPSYISLTYLIDFRKVVPVTWQSMEEVAFHFNLHNLSICGMSIKFVCAKTHLFLFDIIAIETNGKPLLKRRSSILPQFCSDSDCCLVCQRDFSACSKVNLLNDDTYRCDSATIIMSCFGQIEQSVD